MKRLKPVLAVIAAALLLTSPETTLNAAREAMYTWAQSVAPALFPFMAMMPLLTCRESAQAYEAIAGRLMRPLFGLPGAAAPAVVMGMTAGSPAGMQAACELAGPSGMSRRALERMSLCCGLSPAFLITGVGASMLGSAADGRMLMSTQLAAQLLLLVLSRFAKGEEAPAAGVFAGRCGGAVGNAVNGTLAVCGYMVLFRVFSARFAELCRSETVGLAALCLLDAPSGAQAVSALPLPHREKMVLLAAVTGFGGLCVAAQNLSTGAVRPVKYLAAKLISALTAAAIMSARLHFPCPAAPKILPILPAMAISACFLTVPVWKYLLKNIFLNKTFFAGNGENLLENAKKPQDMVFPEKCNTKMM